MIARLFSCFLLCLISSLANAGTVTYIYTDHQGTPLAEADAQGGLTATFDYRPYGGLALGGASAGPGFTGHVTDMDTALVYMQARYYDPAVGRFLSVDPAMPGVANVFNFNRYGYANNSPYVYVDPDGRCANLCTAAVGVVVGAVVGAAIEGYKQARAGSFNGRALAVETGKGAVVGGLMGLTGGAAAASGLTLEAQLATNFMVGTGVGTGAEAIGEVAKGNPAPSPEQSLNVGLVTGLAGMAGSATAPGARALTTTVTPAIKAFPVNSVSGKTFYTLNVPAKVIERPVMAEAVNSLMGGVVEEDLKHLE
ncbi:RHS repeat domain-containing protein [Dyella jiangningensis]|nr:RHS repeat-associated core domain-containing protein [Dyella jiangningensis]